MNMSYAPPGPLRSNHHLSTTHTHPSYTGPSRNRSHQRLGALRAIVCSDRDYSSAHRQRPFSVLDFVSDDIMKAIRGAVDVVFRRHTRLNSRYYRCTAYMVGRGHNSVLQAHRHTRFFSDSAVKQILLTMNEKQSFIIEDLDDHTVVIKADEEWRVRRDLEIEVRYCGNETGIYADPILVARKEYIQLGIIPLEVSNVNQDNSSSRVSGWQVSVRLSVYRS
jgi:TFIIH basal transcription factor complex TTD-A subunit